MRTPLLLGRWLVGITLIWLSCEAAYVTSINDALRLSILC